MDRDGWRWIKGQEKGEMGKGEREGERERRRGKEEGKGTVKGERRKEKKSKEKNNRYFPKIAMLFGVAPSAKNNDFTAWLCHLPSFFFCAIYFEGGVTYEADQQTEQFADPSSLPTSFGDGKQSSLLVQCMCSHACLRAWLIYTYIYK